MQQERDLILLAKEGNEDAFERLVLAHQKKVYNLALRMTGNAEDACDLSQEAFLRVFKGLANFEMESSFSTWIYRLTSNACIDFLRKKKRQETVSLVFLDDNGDERYLELPDERYEPEYLAGQMETKEEVTRAIGSLEVEYRQALVLRELNGCSYAEIAEIMGIKEGTVKSRIFRAREQMKKRLTERRNFSDKLPSNKTEEKTRRR